jgi:hypothetical protein
MLEALDCGVVDGVKSKRFRKLGEDAFNSVVVAMSQMANLSNGVEQDEDMLLIAQALGKAQRKISRQRVDSSEWMEDHINLKNIMIDLIGKENITEEELKEAARRASPY